MYVCAQKNERLTHVFMRISFWSFFPDFHIVVIFFYSSEFMCRVLFFYFFIGIKVAFFIPPPHTLVTHDEKNQAKCNKSSNEQTKKIERCVYII